MNHRIRQLALQAEQYADDKLQMPGEYHPDWYDIRDEKFAELLIRECMSVIGEENYGMLTGKANCTKIKQHFGVK